jgi:HlyD family secretion protein
MKKRLVFIILLLFLAAAVIYALSQSRRDETTWYGNVDIREVALAFRQSGRLTTLTVNEGDRVAQGDVLATLDAQPFEDNLKAAQAKLAQATAEHNKLLAGFRAQEIEAARETLREAQAVLRQRQTEYARQTRLKDSGDTSQKQFDATKAARDVAAANEAAAQQKLSLVEEGARAEDIAAAAAAMRAAQAQVAIAQTALDDTRLVAPEGGIVMSRVREPGSMVGPQAAVLTLSLRQPIYVRAYVSEPDLAAIALGQAVTLRVDGSEKTYHGQIGYISPRAEFTPKSVETPDLRTDLVYRVRITVSDDDDALKQGMPVTIQFTIHNS